MKVAIIPPIAYLGKYSTDYHLVLAHLYKQSEPYRRFYNERREKGDFVIMDNGAAELGSSIEAAELVTLAKELRPNVLICPDVLREGDATMAATNHFLDTYAILLHSMRIKFMAVPQGKTAEEWDKAFIWFDSDPAVDWLGISKYVKGAFPSRLDALRLIQGRVHKSVHLLGMADDPYVVELEKKFKFAKSTDTAVPVKLGLQNLSMHDYSRLQRRPDNEYFNLPVGYISERIEAQVLANICHYRGICK